MQRYGASWSGECPSSGRMSLLYWRGWQAIKAAGMSPAIVQFLSAGKRSLREKTHGGDAGLEPRNSGLAIRSGFVDRLHGQAHALLVLEGQFARRLEDTVGVNGLDLLSHALRHSQITAGRTWMQRRAGRRRLRANARLEKLESCSLTRRQPRGRDGRIGARVQGSRPDP